MFLRNILLSQGSTVVTPASLKAASTADLNGSSQYFSLGSGLTTGKAQVTIGGWVKLDTTADQDIYYEETGSATFIRFSLRYISGGLQFGCRDSNTGTFYNITGSSLSTGTWYYLMGIADTTGNSLELYIDNVLDNSSSPTMGTIYNGSYANNPSLGARRSGTTIRYLNGGVAFFGLWDTALDSGQRTALYNSGDALAYNVLETQSSGITTNLVSYWHMANYSGSTGTEIEDRHGSNDLTNVGSIGFTGSGLDVLS